MTKKIIKKRNEKFHPISSIAGIYTKRLIVLTAIFSSWSLKSLVMELSRAVIGIQWVSIVVGIVMVVGVVIKHCVRRKRD